MGAIIQSEYDISFLPKPNEGHVILDDRLPPAQLITSALGLVFDGNRLVLPKLVDRGWDIPGGHIESAESPEEAFRRETLEEVGAVLGRVSLLGYQKLVIHAPIPEGYKYPYPSSYQTFFWATVASFEQFEPTFEVSERGLFPPEEALQLSWVQKHEALYRHALNLQLRQL